MKDIKTIEEQQIEYYQARASEYDEWFLRKGRFDRGEEINRPWFVEVDGVRKILEDFKPEGRILELACGTGLWTQELIKYSNQITAVDAVKEVIELNKRRLQSDQISYIQANIFQWKPVSTFDVIFFSFWLSHVSPNYFTLFWKIVEKALAPGGRVFFIDSKYDQKSTAKDHILGEEESGIANRKLNDGREFQIVKIFYKSKILKKQLQELSWNITVQETPTYFIYGYGNHISIY
jgi:2-polyprenyl-3-methyl-5-hydroxy-6-metoxy-1,4-benzoquinol methylase